MLAIMTIAGNMIGAAVSLLWGVWHGLIKLQEGKRLIGEYLEAVCVNMGCGLDNTGQVFDGAGPA